VPTLLTFSTIASICVSLEALGNIFFPNSTTYFYAADNAVVIFLPISEPGSTLAKAAYNYLILASYPTTFA